MELQSNLILASEESRCVKTQAIPVNPMTKWRNLMTTQHPTQKEHRQLLALPNMISLKDIRQVAIGRSQALRRETAPSRRGDQLSSDPTHVASRAAE